MLVLEDLHKRFGARAAVQGVTFRVAAGETVALVGENGAGKTTTIAMICGHLTPDRGRVLVDGQVLAGPADPAKRTLGLAPQQLALYDELTARENLRFFGALYGLDGRTLRRAADAVLELVGLTERAGERVGTLSGGMQRRLNLAAALVHDPKIVVLDEPTVGVDPQSRQVLLHGLDHLRRQGKAIVYATHHLDDVERLCDRVVVLDRGQVAADDTVRALLAGAPTPIDASRPGLEAAFLALVSRGTRGR